MYNGKRPEINTRERNIPQSESFTFSTRKCWILRTCRMQLHYRDI